MPAHGVTVSRLTGPWNSDQERVTLRASDSLRHQGPIASVFRCMAILQASVHRARYHPSLRYGRMDTSFRRASQFILAAFLCAPGCVDPPFTGNCTLIGCDSGLVLEFTNAPPGPWSASVVSSIGNRTFNCAAGATCDLAFFGQFLPAAVTVTMTVGQQSSESQGTPTPRTVRPNGAACEPSCSQPVFKVTAP